MKSKYLVILVSAAFLTTGCKDKYQEGFNAGHAEGLTDGRADGHSDGFYDGAYSSGQSDGYDQGLADGEAYYAENDTFGEGYTIGYNETYQTGVNVGYADGRALGYSESYDASYTRAFNEGDADGYNDGYTDGSYAGAADGSTDGYNDGYAVGEQTMFSAGYDDGYSDGEYVGYQEGYDDGSNAGYNDGYDDNYTVGYDEGYADGEVDGYEEGYDDGYYDASMGYAGKSSNPSVKMAAMVNADLIDYTKLQKFDSKSVMSAGLVLSHADSGTVDMEKLASLKEAHYLNQMAQQIQAKFGLSSDRAQNIATVAHQFNKLSGSRELTEKDANVFAVGVIGKNLKDVEAAVAQSLKGDSAQLDSMLKEIAGHNGTSPENVNRIIGEIFF